MTNINKKINKIKELNRYFLQNIRFLEKKYNKSKLYFYIDYLKTLIFHKASPKDYLFYRMYKLSSVEKSNVITYKRSEYLDKNLNDFDADHSIIGAKSKFLEDNRQYCKREYINSIDSELKDLIEFLEKNKSVIYKPNNASKGQGVEKIIYDKKGIDLLTNNKNNDVNYILETIIVQHEVLSSINSNSVNTVRVNTILNKKGEVEIVGATLRTARGVSLVDNMANGGIIFPLDINTGIISGPGLDYNYGKEYYYHPYSNKKMVGLQIPNWEDVIEAAQNIALKYKNFRWLGFDIAVVDKGVEVIEANLSADPRITQASFDFKYNYLKNQI